MLPLLIALATLVPTGHVNDFAHLLRPETVDNLETILKDFETNTGAEIAVVTIDTHGPDETIETYAVKLFEQWKIGKEKEDNGLLLLVSRDDREMRIEVGYGLEPIITDIESGRIIREVLTPAFQEGQYDAGVEHAITRIIDDIGRGEAPPNASPGLTPEQKLWVALFILVLLINIYRWRKGKRGIYPIFINMNGGGGRGSGFGGFGGGSSGGGGASGRW